MKIKAFLIIFLLTLVLLCASCAQTSESYDVVATIFPGYDFAREIAGEDLSIKQLLPPGSESHSYEISARDIIAIQNCKLFICVGGESEDWVDSILESMDQKPRVIRMMDSVSVLDEEIKEGMDHDHDDHGHDDHSDHDHSDHHHGEGKYDEHVWTSPENAAMIVQDIRDAMAEQFPESADSIKANADEYIAKLGEPDGRFESLFEGCELCLIFGDRFPLRYFVERYGIDYYAAFPGCSADSEVSASTVAFLIDKVNVMNIPTVFHIEFSNHVIADSIAESTGASVAQFYTCHNVSKKQLDEGATYLSLMEENYRTMEKYIAQIGG